jgi:hypothetical protein
MHHCDMAKRTRRVALPRINSSYQSIKSTGDSKQYYQATSLTIGPANSVQIIVDELFSVLGPGGTCPSQPPGYPYGHGRLSTSELELINLIYRLACKIEINEPQCE